MSHCTKSRVTLSSEPVGFSNSDSIRSPASLLRPTMTMLALPFVYFANARAIPSPTPEVPPMKTATGAPFGPFFGSGIAYEARCAVLEDLTWAKGGDMISKTYRDSIRIYTSSQCRQVSGD